MLIHSGCFIHSLVKAWVYDDYDNIINGVPALTVQYYFYYQLPFDLLNIAIVTHIHQWLEIKHTLIYALDMHESHEDDELDADDSLRTDGASGFPTTVPSGASGALVSLRQSGIFKQGG